MIYIYIILYLLFIFIIYIYHVYLWRRLRSQGWTSAGDWNPNLGQKNEKTDVRGPRTQTVSLYWETNASLRQMQGKEPAYPWLRLESQGVKKKITKESSTFPRHRLRFNVLAAIWKRRSTAKLRSSNHLPYPTSDDVVEQDESPAAFGVSKVSMWSATKIKRIITA